MNLNIYFCIFLCMGVAAAHATGDKCERCWKYSADIGTHAAHPTLCARCAAVVEG